MKVLLIGHYGGKNFGDEVMLGSLLGRLQESELIEKIYVITKPRTVRYYSEDSVEYINPNLIQVIWRILEVNWIVLGGGTHFHDGYSASRFRKHVFYLLKMLSLFGLGKLFGKKIFQVGVGFGPFHDSLALRLARLSIRMSDFVTVRDTASLENLKLKPESEKLSVSFDLAALHDSFRGGSAGNNPEIEDPDSRDWIGISVTSFRYNEYRVEDDFWERCFFRVISDLFRESEIRLKIFVFRGGQKESDLPLSQKLYGLLASIDPERVKLVPFTEDLDSFIGEMKTCRKLIATRYHSAVLGYLCHCDLFIIPYHEKLIAFADQVQLPAYAVYGFYNRECDELEEELSTFASNSAGDYRAQLETGDAVESSEKNMAFLGRVKP